jgi:DegV family protein with EDD domain
MKIQLITDSTCDLDPSLLEKRGILFAPLTVHFGDGDYVDKLDLSHTEFYEKMRETPALPSTSQVNPDAFLTLFEKVTANEEGAVLGLFLSSELSGTYNSAVIARNMMTQEQAKRIVLIDSRTVSFALSLLVLRTQDMIDDGLPLSTIVEEMNHLIVKAHLYGMLNTLENLKKGGRLSAGTAMIGKMLNLKPIIEVTDGRVNMAAKVRGEKKGFQWMLEKLREDFPNGVISDLAVAHANDEGRALAFKALIEEEFTLGRFILLEIGSVVGTHTGEGAVGIGYLKD